MLVRMWRNQNFIQCWWGCKIIQLFIKVQVMEKINICLKSPSHFMPRKAYLHNCIQMSSFFVHNSSKVEEIQPSMNSCCCYLFVKSCPTLLLPHRLQPARLLCPWDFPGKNTGVGLARTLLQRTFLIQGSNPSLLLGRKFLYH